MGKVILEQQTENGMTNFIAGTILDIREGTGRGEGKVRTAVMDLTVFEDKKSVGKRIEIAMWDDDKHPDNKRRQVATRSRNAKMAKDTFVMFTCGNITEKDSKSNPPVLAATAFDFAYNTRRSVEVDTEKGLYTNEIICSTIRRMNLDCEHPYIVVPVNTFANGVEGTDWITIFLKNDVEYAKKYMQVGLPIACLTNEIRESESNGYRNLTCNMFTYVLGKAKK